ncbi:MAG: D-glycero-beta-D-manno-heptose 1-phosphate adenylyltransferase [Phycisphaerales bacterium]|nr:D-glycero-beta-D-manno-heptose 1-phosphate adenylyltransferase [Phycisphaerales bacterium]
MAASTPRILDGLKQWKPFRLLVVGDLMLDQTLEGDAERLSPDAPVPVLAVRDPAATIDTAGGAGNVGVFAAALGGIVEVVGVVGDDPEARLLTGALQRGGCSTEGVLTDRSRPTTTKRSLVGRAQHRHPQKMFRIDVESPEPLSAEVQAELLRRIKARIPSCDVLCLEDYRKGVCTPELCAAVIKACREQGIPVLVDPAPIADFSRYAGATAITPNRSEAERATGVTVDPSRVVEGARVMARQLREALALEVIVVTLDREGALLLERDGHGEHLPTVVRQVYDVTGAGDMVLAVLAGAVANHMPWADAVALANVAAGLEVEVFGVRSLSIPEIRAQFLRQTQGAAGKQRSREDLAGEIAAHQKAGRRIVLTNGCFDVIHAGHIAYLREAKAQGDILVVGVNSDESVRAIKGDSRPIYSEQERVEILGELTSIDYLTVFSETTAEELLRTIRPDIYVKGGDYTVDEVAESALVKSLAIEIKILQHRAGQSTTSVVERVRAQCRAGENAATP